MNFRLLISISLSFLLVARLVSAFPEHGLSVALESTSNFLPNKWQSLKGWKMSEHLTGQYIRVLRVDDTLSVITIQRPGIYYISFHILIDEIMQPVEAGVSINGKQGMFPIFTSVGKNKTSTFGASGFVRLTASDTLAVLVYSSESFTVREDTALTVRYHNDASSVSGFLFSAPAYTLDNKTTSVTLGPWSDPVYGQFSSSSGFQPGHKAFTVPVDGIYMITFNIILTFLQLSDQVRLKLFAGEVLITDQQIVEVAFATQTVNLNEIVRLQFGESLRIVLYTAGERINVAGFSSWSVLLVKRADEDNTGFHASLDSIDYLNSLVDYESIGQWTPRNDTVDFTHFESGSASLESGRSFNTKSKGMYYVTADISCAILVNDTFNASFSLAFYQESRGIFSVKHLKTMDQMIRNSAGLSKQIYRLSLSGVYELSADTPISVAMKGVNLTRIIIFSDSTFGVIETSSSYPGAHIALDKTIHRYDVERFMVDSYKSFLLSPGFYDFTRSVQSGVFTATENGLYLATANVVVASFDVGANFDQPLYAFIKRSSQDADGFVAVDANPGPKMTLNLGGLLPLKRGDRVLLELDSSQDTDWDVPNVDFCVSYMGLAPVHFQSALPQNLRVTEKSTQITSWLDSLNGVLLSGEFTAPGDGVHFMVANIIVKEANQNQACEYRIYFNLNGRAIKGLHSVRRTKSEVFTLFASGSFYVKKGDRVTSVLSTSVQTDFLISEDSRWAITQVGSDSGGLGVLDSSKSYFSHVEWFEVGFLKYQTDDEGQFLFPRTLLFDSPQYIRVVEEGIYLVSANFEILYRGRLPQQYKLAIHFKDDIAEMTSWQTVKWGRQTLHVCGTLYLKPGDEISPRLKFEDYTQTDIMVGSGFSIVLLPEVEITSSFTAELKRDQEVDASKLVVKDWLFPSQLASIAFNLQTGVLDILQTGFHAFSVSLLFERTHESTRNVTLSIVKNSQAIRNITEEFLEDKVQVSFQDTLYLNAGDQIHLCVSSFSYNTTSNQTNTKTFLRSVSSHLSVMFLPDSLASRAYEMQVFTDRLLTTLDKDQNFGVWGAEGISGNTAGDYSVTTTGIHLLMTSIELKAINGSVRVTYTSSEKILCSSEVSCHDKCHVTLEMKCFVRLLLNDAVNIRINTRDNPVTVGTLSRRVVTFLSDTQTGAGLILDHEKHLSNVNNDDRWSEVGPWSANQTGHTALFHQNFRTFQNELVYLMPGTYQIVATLIILVVEKCSQFYLLPCDTTIEAGIFVDGVLSSIYQRRTFADDTTTVTVTLSGNLNAVKWSRMVLKVRASRNVTVLMQSQWGVINVLESSFSRISDKGPIMLTSFSETPHKTFVVGMTMEWLCEATGDGNITYLWFRNEQIILSQNDTDIGKLTIGGYLNDSGTYKCVAELDNIQAASNNFYVDIYDIDECDLSMHSCSNDALCENTPGGYACECNQGFSGDGITCVDTNECVELDQACAEQATCTDIPGSWECRCNHGWKGDGKVKCTDVDECEQMETTDCDQLHSNCTNTIGGYNCTCHHGWLGDNGTHCIDENECETGNYDCHTKAFCSNKNASYSCICIQGYTMMEDGYTCENDDECGVDFEELRRNQSRCVENAECVDTQGDYTCQCKQGYRGNGTKWMDNQCTDINECENPNICHANAECKNSDGGYECNCVGGYEKGASHSQCVDIDECTNGESVCKNGNCTNLIGTYTCACKENYRLNGFTCVVATVPDNGAQKTPCEEDSSSMKCICTDKNAMENNVLCNGLFLALIILSIVALIVIIFVVKYAKSRKQMKIGPVKVQRDKYIEMENESEL